MSRKNYLLIGEVARLTGLTDRALRFYEERGLVQPIRTDGGRRAYAADDLIRINHIMLLRRSRFSLSQIRSLLDASGFDARTLIDLQIETLRSERSMIDISLKSLASAKSDLVENTDINLENLCELIRIGEQKMQNDAWQKVYDKYYTPAEQENWKAAKENLDQYFFQDEYQEQWRDLVSRIEKALPMDPASDKARSFLQEWKALLAPFLRVADDQLKAGASRLWNHMDEWSDQVQSPIPKKVWAFISIMALDQERESSKQSRLFIGGLMERVFGVIESVAQESVSQRAAHCIAWVLTKLGIEPKPWHPGSTLSGADGRYCSGGA